MTDQPIDKQYRNPLVPTTGGMFSTNASEEAARRAAIALKQQFNIDTESIFAQLELIARDYLADKKYHSEYKNYNQKPVADEFLKATNPLIHFMASISNNEKIRLNRWIKPDFSNSKENYMNDLHEKLIFIISKISENTKIRKDPISSYHIKKACILLGTLRTKITNKKFSSGLEYHDNYFKNKDALFVQLALQAFDSELEIGQVHTGLKGVGSAIRANSQGKTVG